MSAHTNGVFRHVAKEKTYGTQLYVSDAGGSCGMIRGRPGPGMPLRQPSNIGKEGFPRIDRRRANMRRALLLLAREVELQDEGLLCATRG